MRVRMPSVRMQDVGPPLNAVHALPTGSRIRHGMRPTLEEAYKATANLLFKHAKDFWLRMDTRAVTAPWASVLPGGSQ